MDKSELVGTIVVGAFIGSLGSYVGNLVLAAVVGAVALGALLALGKGLSAAQGG